MIVPVFHLEFGSTALWRRACGSVCFGLVALALAACQPKSDGVGADASSGPVKLDTFCSAPGLPPALRETTIVVDTSAITAASPEEFRAKNPELFKLVIGLADPAQAIESGAVAPRERVTLLAGSAPKGTLSPIFTGCLPGASAAELAAIQSSGGGSAAQKYFGSDLPSRISKQQADFTRQILLALMRLDQLSDAKLATSSGFDSSPLVKLLKLLGAPNVGDNRVRRLFLFTDISTSSPDVEKTVSDSRRAGFKVADQIGLNLALDEVYLISPGSPPDDLTQQFFQAFALGSQGDLRRVGGWSANGLTAAPAQVVSYSGQLSDGVNSGPMTLQIASTASGEMVNSWISYTASFGQRSTPIKGQFICTAERVCTLRSDPTGGLGQLWRYSQGSEPEAREDAPFGGLRFMSATETNAGIDGRIFDPVISIGHPGGGMNFTGKRVGG
ncbi:MAG: hypothetical protein P4L64_11900 [Caulobacteraceae bacterium]|nr:hypothetical protein [Caulobacteraceae bacterium]